MLEFDISLRPLRLDKRCHLPGAGLDHSAQAVDLFSPGNQRTVQVINFRLSIGDNLIELFGSTVKVFNLRLSIGDNLIELMHECISLLQGCIQLMHLGITISHSQIEFMDPGFPIPQRFFNKIELLCNFFQSIPLQLPLPKGGKILYEL